jgi:moderate conductance mechanosensitive channel
MQSFYIWLKDMMDYPVLAAVSKILGIVILSFLTIRLGSFVIKKIFKKRNSLKTGFDNKKICTMASLLTSTLRYSVYAVAIVIILSDVFGLKSILAAAGVGGIALGLGAQSLIKDIISGFFIIIEDQYAVGDLITIETMNGTVEEFELRVTKLRNFNGDLYIIPNGEIKKVINHTRGNKAVIIDIPLAYSADINKAFDVAGNVCLQVSQSFPPMVEPLKVLGITDLGKDSMILRVTAKTLPNEQWEVERAARKLISEQFALEGIEFFDKNKIVIEGDLAKENSING